MTDDKGLTGLFLHDTGESIETSESTAVSFSNAIMNHPLRAVVPADNLVVSNDIAVLKALAESNAGPPSFNYGFDDTTWMAYSTMHLCTACSLHNFREAFNQWVMRQKKPQLDVEGCFLALNETVGHVQDMNRDRGNRGGYGYRYNDSRRGDGYNNRRGDNRDNRRGDSRGYRYNDYDSRPSRVKK